jgi:hypothetical protein
VDTEDAESAELQHFWKILLRGMEVKIPFSGKDKRDSESVDGVLHIFWLDGTTLYLRKEKVHFSSKSGRSSELKSCPCYYYLLCRNDGCDESNGHHLNPTC